MDVARRMSVGSLLSVVLLTCLPVSAALAQDAQLPAEAPEVRQAPDRFMINAFDVTGATVLDASEIEQAIYDFTGPDRTTADVEAARAALQKVYVDRGYESVQVDVPPQPEERFAQGLIEIRVTEAPVGQIRVTGSKYHALSIVRRNVPSLKEGAPLNLRELAADLASANRFPDRSVSPAIAVGKVPGTIDVDLAVESTLPLHGSLELNNDRSPSTEPLRLIASARYTNLWQLGHSVSATYIVAPQDRNQSEVISASYSAPLIGTPWTLILYGYSSNTDIAALGGSNVLGNGYQIGTRAVLRLPGDKLAQNLTFGFDYKNFDQDILVAGQLATRQPIEYIPLFASYGVSSAGEKLTADLSVSLTMGLRAFKKVGCFDVTPGAICVPTDQFKNKDFDSKENFVHANIEGQIRRTLPRDFIAALKFAGQIADSRLVSNEQFSIGGLSSVRGYLVSEGVGDDGYSLSLELNSPSFAPSLPQFVDELRVLAFVEGGEVRTINALPDVARHRALLSVGGGMRLRLFNALSGELAVGTPLLDGSDTKKNSVLTTFSLKGEF